ncbi:MULTISPECIES: helix-turn-helix domain-containing protein [Paenibacillus]|jgi:transcriptional regulator with XRE-family HTH domain|uniref:Transcriptional regulator n=3 Tax=Paenibacillus TaxID=44249 RepID=A0AAJ3MHF6_PAEPO|nr:MULTISPECIES: helix-turn-helix transcriptional regulator [Paenibacillus]KAF6633161.1 helix-turn-helix transcriptional regulator [Paenibacillus sp. EKM208P]MCF2717694.1 helix-turn-helix domain-containing protein [Paenibacillus sp. UKAQ_18]AHC18720.1 transcriptional regulator [Paenibacillus polymyxa CR1]ALA41011.1 transcriptional regulator [Paenibacillus peoriae]APB72292.1 XRE family transcriptional regulator [Paenibacillus polymyxa]
MSELLELVGTRIRDIRKSKGLSQEALAEKAGFNSSYIGFIERAERNISLKNLEKIAKALNVGVYQLLTYVKDNDELTEEDSSIKTILTLLRTRESKDTELALKILTDIFIRIDER